MFQNGGKLEHIYSIFLIALKKSHSLNFVAPPAEALA